MDSTRFDLLLTTAEEHLTRLKNEINAAHAQMLLRFLVDHGVEMANTMSEHHEEWLNDLINYFYSHHYTPNNCSEFLDMCEAFINDMRNLADIDL